MTSVKDFDQKLDKGIEAMQIEIQLRKKNIEKLKETYMQQL